MDKVSMVGEYALLVLGALVAVLGGLHGALALLAPKTESTVDDKALGFVDKVKAAVEWLAGKLAALLGGVTVSKVERK